MCIQLLLTLFRCVNVSLLDLKYFTKILKPVFKHLIAYKKNPLQGLYCLEFNLHSIDIDYCHYSNLSGLNVSDKGLEFSINPTDIFDNNFYFQLLMDTQPNVPGVISGSTVRNKLYRYINLIDSANRKNVMFVQETIYGFLQITSKDILNTSLTVYYKPTLSQIDLENLLIN